MARRSKRKRKRVSREDVKRNAVEGGSGGSNWFTLPDGVGSWAPEKAASHMMDFLPYEVTDKNHPDKVELGVLWYKRQFGVHHGIGVQNASYVCPRSINKPCCICEARDKLISNDRDKHEKVIGDLKPQQFVAYNVFHPEEDDKIAVFCVSWGKFAQTLDKELKEQDEEVLDFFLPDEGGMTLKVRFSDASYAGRPYLEATRIDFRDRKDMDEEEILERTVNLDEMLNVLPYDKLKDTFLQIDEDEGDDDAPRRGRSRPRLTDETDGDGEDNDADLNEDPEDGGGGNEDNDADFDDRGDDPEDDDSDGDGDSIKCPQCDEEFEEDDGVESKKLKLTFCSTKCRKAAQDEAAEEGASDEKEDKKAAAKEKKEAAAKKSKGKGSKELPICPVEGGTFGETVDKFDECDDCDFWDACEAGGE